MPGLSEAKAVVGPGSTPRDHARSPQHIRSLVSHPLIPDTAWHPGGPGSWGPRAGLCPHTED